MSHGGDDLHPPAPLDLLDEYWFFSNTLNVKNNNDNNGSKKKPPPPPLPRSSPSTSSNNTKPQRQGLLGCQRRLLRTPSLPSPRPSCALAGSLVVEDQQQAAAEVDDDDLNWSSIYEGILRTRIAAQGSSRSSSSSALQRAPSMPVDEGRRKEQEMPKNSKLRHSYSTLERHCTPSNNKQQTPRSSGEVRSKQQQQRPPVMTMVRSKSTMFHQQAADKKWKSSSDLECIEVQGFKDLGFVFDKEDLREDLADVLPGLKNATTTGHGAVTRPYLSEAWRHDRRRSAPPALIRLQSEARSAAEMKDQLRMWAQAVACNVRQDCA